eukprot:331657_1
MSSEKVWTNLNISVMAIGWIYALIFLCIIGYNYLISTHKKKQINRTVISLAIGHMFSWLIDFICRMITYINNKNHLGDNNDIPNYIIMIMIIFHPIFFYSLWTFRMYYAFNTSQYKLKVYEFFILLICFLVLLISRIIEQGSWMLVVSGNSPIIPIETLINCLWTFIAFDIVTRLILVYLFVRKLFLLVMSQTDNKMDRTYSQSNTTTNNN